MMWTDILDIQFPDNEDRVSPQNIGLFAIWSPDTTGIQEFYCKYNKFLQNSGNLQ
jgi:hypothetical protein